MCADATYKIIWNGFPIFIIGTTDLRRKFHPISAYVCSNETTEDFTLIFTNVKVTISRVLAWNYSSEILIADGAEQITNGFTNSFGNQLIRVMCWAHVERIIEKRLSMIDDKLLADEIFDIFIFSCLIRKTYFNSAVSLMKKCFILYFNEDSWPLSTCTCYNFFKKYMCICSVPFTKSPYL